MCFLKFSCFYYKCEAYDRGTSLTIGKCNLSYSQLCSQINQERVTLMGGKVWGQKQAGHGEEHGRNDPILSPQSSRSILMGREWTGTVPVESAQDCGAWNLEQWK